MDIEVFDCGSCVGSLHMEKTGLYQTVDCSCRPLSEGILRLFVWKGTQGSCLGVLCPRGMDFTLHKRVSKAGLPFEPEIAVIGCEEAGFRPFRGSFDGAWIEDGYLQTGPEGETLALPAPAEGAWTFLHRLKKTEERTICGRACFVFGQEDEASAEIRADDTEEIPEEPSGRTEAEPTEPQTRFHSGI